MFKLDTPCKAYLRVEYFPAADGFHIRIFNADSTVPLLTMLADMNELQKWIANVRLKEQHGMCLMSEEQEQVVGIKPKPLDVIGW